jgi:hypothetical protein
MTFQQAYKELKKHPSNVFLRHCCDWGDLWGFVFRDVPYSAGESFGGGGDFMNKETGEWIDPVVVFTDSARDPYDQKTIPVPRFAAEGWDYYDEKTQTFRLKPDAPYWAKDEFDEFYRTGKFEYEAAQVAEPAQVYGEKN